MTPPGLRRPAPDRAAPPGRVYLHVGEPKTGTTFLQQVMWRNRDALSAHGVVLPGHAPQDHYRAMQDLRGVVKLAGDPAAPWDGEWSLLARQAQSAPRAAVISHELLCAASAAQAERAVVTFDSTDVHVVLTVRDVAGLLPAEWQETVKHRNATGWREWLSAVIDVEAPVSHRSKFWFWRVHDTVRILAIWASLVGPQRVHVITMPPRTAPRELLWQRFADVLGVGPVPADASSIRSNASLGVPETEYLRRFNARVSDEIPGWYYMSQIKEPLAHGVLASFPRSAPLLLPRERLGWANDYADEVITAIQDGGYDVVGDLAELRPPHDDRSGTQPGTVVAAELVDAALACLVCLVDPHRAGHRAPGGGGTVGSRRLTDRLVSAGARHPRLVHEVRRLSGTHRWAARAQLVAWRLLERSRRAR